MSNVNKKAPANYVDLIYEASKAGVENKVAMLRNGTAKYDGRNLLVDGKSLINFGGCSYLGLEQHPNLKQAAINAINDYGTQFSFSRAFIESVYYDDLESLLNQITEGHSLVTPTTSLGHISTLPVIINTNDFVVLDKSVHASVHTAASLLPYPSRMSVIDHNDFSSLEKVLSDSPTKVWYLLDGLYSMYGDISPFDILNELMRTYPNLYLYIDDAHSTSWAGKNGRGLALDRITDRNRLVVSLSLNKAFSCAGGAIIFPTAELRERVRYAGGPMLFSGPVQPAMLSAAVASAKLHLEPDHTHRQNELSSRISYVIDECKRLGIHLTNPSQTPIFFVKCGKTEDTLNAVKMLIDLGFYTSPGVFPAVSHTGSGIRFTLSLAQNINDIDNFLAALKTVIH
jgi:7-keto-8-aminopelargonate synthetase-like enzyme